MSESATLLHARASSESKLEAWAPHEGEIVGGRYRVMRVIGQGGMGAVVSAEHVQLGEPVAIKFLHPKLARDTPSVERFFREAKATMRIKSEHVVRIIDVGKSENGVPYIVMELLEGADLGRVLDAGPLAVSHAVDFVLQACEALAEAHAAGIVHRDLKPSNLWLAQRPDGSPLVKVLDFGISKLSSHAPGDPKLTETQSVFGSPTYMSPEQIRSSKKVDHRTDVWALGIVLHELLTGKLPFDGDTVSGVLASIAADPPVPIRQVRADVPAGVEVAILRCLEKDLGRRCQSLAELAVLLEPFASPIGVLSAGRIARIGAPQNMSLSLSGSAPRDSSPFGITERNFSTASLASSAPRSPVFAVALGMGVALLIVGLLAGGAKLGAARSAKVTGAPIAKEEVPSASPPPVQAPAASEGPRAVPPTPSHPAAALASSAKGLPRSSPAVAAPKSPARPAGPHAAPSTTVSESRE